MVLSPCRILRLGMLIVVAGVSIPWASAQGPSPGQNVNMVSGTKWPGGDPFLERQNEPSIAVSTRNPLHLLAGANDYRTVDLNLVDQLPIDELAGDAWLGVFKSFDGGNRWQSTLLPGFPQDLSSFGAASPMKGFIAASDPVVRAGTNGMFYYGGIAFNRPSNVGGLFMARFIDLNNKENGDAAQSQYPSPTTDPIRYIGTVKIDSGTAGQFLDKPWVAVDIPRAGAGNCNILVTQSDGTTVTQTFPAGNVYIAYAMFVGGVINVRSKIDFAKSSDCGATWTKPIIISQTYDINQGPSIAIDPQTGNVYVAWRIFSSANDPDAIVVAKSTDGGNTFTKALQAQALQPFNSATPNAPAFFDLTTAGTSFRSNAFPTMAADDKGTLYLAWSQRGQGPMGEARIMISTSSDGVAWSSPLQVDPGAITDDTPGDSFPHGHQFMPSLTFIEGKLMILYYDQRLDHTVGDFNPVTQQGMFVPDAVGKFFHESRPLEGELASGNFPAVFTPFISDANPPLSLRRHTIDVTLAQSNGGANPTFTYARVSQYDFGLLFGEMATTFHQLKVNPPNLPMFMQGQVPFLGDYIDIAGQMFVPTANGSWAYNNPAVNPSSPVHYASWTTNQDVIPPANGDWTKYIPITSGTSVFNGTATQPCQPGTGFEGDRNQNIYGSRITQGLLVSSPQNSKPLSTTVQRAFVVLVQNSTNFQKSFRLAIANQPPGSFSITGQTNIGGFASFQQMLPNPPPLPNPLPAPVTTLDVDIAAHSGVARTVFALSSSPTASMTVNVNELDQSGNILSGGLAGSIVLNADGTVPPLTNPDGAPVNTNISGVEIYDPGVTGPGVTGANATGTNITSPGVTGPGVTGSTCSAPGVTGPGVTGTGCVAPGVTGPGVTGPGVTGSTLVNPGVIGTNVPAPGVTGSAVSDATYTVSNTGNTSAGYNVKLTGCDTSPCKNTPLQLVLSQIYITPGTDGQCNLIPVQQDIMLSNVSKPVFTPMSQLSSPGVTGGAVSNPAISLAPGDTALITLRGFVDTATMKTIVTQVAPAVVPQAIDTNSDATTPPVAVPLFITTASLPDGVAPIEGTSTFGTLSAIGGSLSPTCVGSWSLSNAPAALSVSPASFTPGNPGISSATLSGSLAPGTYTFTVQVQDCASPTPNIAIRQFTLNVYAPIALGTTSLPSGLVNTSYGPVTLVSGGTGTYTFTLTSGVIPPGLAITSTGQLAGNLGSAAGTFTFTLTFQDAAHPAQSVSGTFTLHIFANIGLSFFVQPGNTVVGQLIPAAQVLAMDSTGAAIPNLSVSVSLGSTSFSASLGGTTTRTTGPAGVAIFTDLTVTPAGIYTLLASAGSASISSILFTIYGFSAVGQMNSSRAFHTATLLSDGTVLVAGGQSTQIQQGPPPVLEALLTADIYTPATRTFASISCNNGDVHCMISGRAGHTATLLTSGANAGMVLIAGGVSSFQNGVLPSSTNTTELYNPSTKTFAAGPPMSCVRAFHTATLLPNGDVLMAGGQLLVNSQVVSEACVEVYHALANSFSQLANLLEVRAAHAATLLGSGKVLVTGGRSTNADGTFTFSSTAELYDPTGNGSTTTAGLFCPTVCIVANRASHTSTLLTNGTVLVAGGQSGNASTQPGSEIYDPVLDSFSVGAQIGSRAYHSAVLLDSGNVAAFGGWDSHTALSDSPLFPSTGTGNTTEFASMAFSRFGLATAVLNDGSVLIAGGVSGANAFPCGGGNPIPCNIDGYLNRAEIFFPQPTPPIPPTSLTAAVQGGPPPAAESVTLAWTASTSNNVIGYNVFRGTTAGGPYTKIASLSAANIGYTDITVVSGTTYYYVVTAVGPGNVQSVNSNEAVAVVP